MEQTRILLADLPRMLGQIIRDVLAAEPDLEVLEVPERGALAELATTRPDVVVIGRDDSRLAADLLEQRPRMKVLAVAGDGIETSLYELRPQRVRLGEVSPQRLVEVIRAAAQVAPAEAWIEG